jgi:mevalonate kinase
MFPIWVIIGNRGKREGGGGGGGGCGIQIYSKMQNEMSTRKDGTIHMLKSTWLEPLTF